MTFFLRHLLPFTYFQASRLNKWIYVVYHALLEWIPAAVAALIYNDFNPRILVTAFLSYLAFISLYEIGYLTNDFLSEKFEADPRERSKGKNVGDVVVWSLVAVRIAVFVVLTFVLAAQFNAVWWIFHAALLVTFALHNIWEKSHRLTTFFNLSLFRFFAPLILCLSKPVLLLLIPVVMLNYSLFRIITYGASKNLINIPSRDSIRFKYLYYLNCIPFSLFLSIAFDSFVPILFCLYYILMWTAYNVFQQALSRSGASSESPS